MKLNIFPSVTQFVLFQIPRSGVQLPLFFMLTSWSAGFVLVKVREGTEASNT